jgi:hypothetical protein
MPEVLNSIVIQTYDIENQLNYDFNHYNPTEKKTGKLKDIVSYFKSALISVSNNK